MSGRVQGRVALVTGAARGQGRSHAVRLAQEGADIIAVDLCDTIPSVAPLYAGATEADLAETVSEVEALDRRIVATRADVRDYDALADAVRRGIAELGRLDIVCANAGIFVFGDTAENITEQQWDDVSDVNLKGVWHTCKAVIPHLIEQGEGGSIVITSSTAGLRGSSHTLAYGATKHAVVGVMRTLAVELGRHGIRVNTIHPAGVATEMIFNEATFRRFLPGEEHPTREQAAHAFASHSVLGVPWVEPVDISNAVLFLASDEARYVTGLEMKVDAGFCLL